MIQNQAVLYVHVGDVCNQTRLKVRNSVRANDARPEGEHEPRRLARHIGAADQGAVITWYDTGTAVRSDALVRLSDVLAYAAEYRAHTPHGA